MESWKRLLLENKAWAQDMASHPGNEDPVDDRRFLWIGCSDARTSAEQVTGSGAGELFVHRNVANLVVHSDLNLLAALECAVGQAGVKQVIVCGHYGCLGVRAAEKRTSHGLLDSWLNHVKDTWQANKEELDLHDADTAHRRLVELNVMQQVRNLARTSVIQHAWQSENKPTLHGWVYNPDDHMIRPLVKVDADTNLDHVHALDLAPEA